MNKYTPNWNVDELSPSALVMNGQVIAEAKDFKPDGCSIEEGRANIRLASASADLLWVARLALEASQIDMNDFMGRIQINILLGLIGGVAKVTLARVDGKEEVVK